MARASDRRTAGQTDGTRPSARARTTIGRPLPEVVLAGDALADGDARGGRGGRPTTTVADVLAGSGADAVAVPLLPAVEGDTGAQPGEGAAQVAALYGIDLAEIADRTGQTGAAGETYVLQLPRPVGTAVTLPWTELPPRIVLVGVGTQDATDLRRAGAALARAARGLDRVVTTVGAQARQTASQVAEAARALTEGYLLAAYAQPTAGSVQPKGVGTLVLLGRDGTRVAAAVDAATSSASATWLVRDLASTPSNIKNPAWFADQAKRLATRAGLTTTVRSTRELTAEGFGGILAVGAASASPPRLVTVSYVPEGAANGKHVVIVGKGITFDTGGLSIKPRESMVTQKSDMTGAAVALATVLGAAEASVRHRVTAVMPLAENHFGASSYRPGDVLRMYGGTTVEIANTDAEGRLVLADALAWADETLDPDVLVDVATLTGAAAVGLGRTHGALYGTDDALVAALESAGASSGELLWHLPLVDEYEESVQSSIADLRQVPSDTRVGARSIAAALLLRHFVGKRAWAHLDIAGPARASADRHEVTEGPTGFGARLLLRYLADLG